MSVIDGSQVAALALAALAVSGSAMGTLIKVQYVVIPILKLLGII